MVPLALFWLGVGIGGVVVLLLGHIQRADVVLRRYERIVSSAPDGIALLDRTYTYQLVNQTYLSRAQTQQENLIGYTIGNVIGEARFQSQVKPQFDRCLAGETVRYEEWLDDADGRRCFIGVTYAPYVELDGTVTGVVVTTRDLTNLKQAEEDLQRSRAFLNQIINVISDTIFVKNEQYRFVLVNRAVCELTGVSEDDFLGRSDYDFFPEEQADHFRQKDQQVFQTGLEDVVEEPLTNLMGETRWLLTKKVCFQNQHGQKFLVGSSQDITELKATEAALRQQAYQEQALNRIVQSIRNSLDLDTIFSTATHEFAQLLQLDLVNILQRFPERHCWVPITEQVRHPELLSTLGVEIADANNPLTARLKQREVVLVEDTHTLSDPINQAAQQHAPAAWLMVPLEVNGAVWGCLVGIKSPLPATFTEDEHYLACRFADQLAIAIQQANFYQQVQQLNQELEQRVQKRTAELIQRNEALYQSEARLQHIATNIPGVLYQNLKRGDRNVLTYISANCQQVFELEPAKIQADLSLLETMVVAEDVDALQQAIALSVKTLQPLSHEYRIITPSGRLKWIHTRSHLEQQPNGDVLWHGVSFDITDRKLAEVEVRRSKDLFEAIFEESADAIFLVDPSSLLIEDCNRRAIELFEADRKQDLVGIQGHTLHQTPFSEAERLKLRREFSRQGVWSQEIEYRTFKGHAFWGNFASKRIQVAHRQMNLVRITDISHRKQIEAALQASEAHFRRLIADLQVGVVVFNAELIPLLFNSKMLELMEVTADEMLSRTLLDAVWDVIREDGSPMPTAEYPVVLATVTRQPVLDVVLGVYRPITQDRVWLLVTAEPQLDQEGRVKQVIATASDISDRKRAEESLRQFAEREHLLRTVTQQIHHSLDLESILDTTVTEVRQMLQVDRALIFHLTSSSSGVVLKESVLPEYSSTATMFWEDDCFPPECHAHYQQGKPRVILDVALDQWVSCLSAFHREAGVKSKVVAPIVLNLEDTEPHLWGVLVVHSCAYYRQWEAVEVALLQQIANQLAIAIQQSALYQQLQTKLSERRQIEAQLRTSLQEKEVLLKEVHHRVKNNLQVISSMLWLQARAAQHAIVFNALADTRNRLQAMALIHETFYQSTNLGQLSFDDYIQSLVSNILAAHSTRSSPIRLVYHLRPTVLNLETAIPCGLLLNELVTNAVKHAFPNHRAGEICIVLEERTASNLASPSAGAGHSALSQPLTQQPTSYVLTVQDNGVGIPDDLDLENLKSLGLKITYDLALQLRGNLTLDRSSGTRFQLTFSVLEYRKRF
ncbi:PAS domain S-box protein [Oculatella sp. LEGE 06141]|uniref:PAS domain S-box protein n=1 Tax=Oculatella sp. LEGE 06141 TaxID=1828648 RepID=UPI00187E8F9E|nr:PAS domain S-box protein [Oculatella sp. LEGE 06141]MBE9179440.1 PAS domain S-box protein [Oculatella sp. LEGE 06141]